MRHVVAMRIGSLLAVAALATASASALQPQPRGRGGSDALRLTSRATTATSAARGSKHRLDDRSWWGGTYSTATGERVSVRVSTSYPTDDAFAQRWADYLASLVHGPELALVTLYLAPPLEVHELCAQEAEGCYSGNRIVAPGDSSAGVAPSAVIAHEYGHHVAAHRRNPPWNALDWGAKNWSSAVGVCARTAAGTAFPGDEGLHYSLNPGEAFAETYRVLNESDPVGATAWQVVDPSYQPTPEALAAVRRDVLQPWIGAMQQTLRGRFVPGGRRTWSIQLETPLDGDLGVRVRVPRGLPYVVTLLDSNRIVRARALWSGTDVQTLDYRICGVRSLELRIDERIAPSSFEITIGKP